MKSLTQSDETNFVIILHYDQHTFKVMKLPHFTTSPYPPNKKKSPQGGPPTSHKWGYLTPINGFTNLVTGVVITHFTPLIPKLCKTPFIKSRFFRVFPPCQKPTGFPLTPTCRRANSFMVLGGKTSGRIDKTCPNLTKVGPNSSKGLEAKGRVRGSFFFETKTVRGPVKGMPVGWRDIHLSIPLDLYRNGIIYPHLGDFGW